MTDGPIVGGPPTVVGGEAIDQRRRGLWDEGAARDARRLGRRTAPVSVGRAVVVRTFGSAPRPEGAVLLYAADGRIAGSVSGGCVEGAAAEEIERARKTGHARVIRYGISDEQAWDVGLACGGTIDVLVEPVAPAAVIAAARASLEPAGGSRRSSRHSPPTRHLGSSDRISRVTWRAPGHRSSS